MANYKERKTNLYLYFFSLSKNTIPLIFSQKRLMECVTSIFNDKTNIGGVPTLSQTLWGMHGSGNKTSKFPVFMGLVI